MIWQQVLKQKYNCNHGTTIVDQLLAPGQYATAYVANNQTIECMECYENGQLCLKYDCNYVKNPDGKEMTHDVVGQSGWDQCPDNSVHSLSITNLSILNEFFGNDSDKGIAIAKKYRNLFTIEIPKIQKELKNYENISEYYNIEKNEIINNYFNIDETNFINLCTKINLMTSNLENDYNNCSFAFNEDKSIVIITCTYKNGESISLEMDSDEKISVK